MQEKVTRRQAIGAAAGVAGTVYFIGGVPRWLRNPTPAEAATTCSLTPSKTEGPYWVDERLNRSDIRVDPSDGSVQAGIPLTLTIDVYREDDNCTPEQGAIVDIWHANASGLYSDEAVEGTSGRKYLRGYQVTDADGAVKFVTVFPGWYRGRTIHIHVRVRTFSGSATTYDFTTQLFFAESVNDAVLATGAYDTRGARDTTNASDNVYGSDGGSLLVPLTGSVGTGYAGAFGIGLTGLPGTSGTTDSSVSAVITSARFTHADGHRVLKLKLSSAEQVSAAVRLTRSGVSLARRSLSSLSGTKTLHLRLGRHVAGGHAHLRVTFTDAAGNVKTERRTLRVPRSG
jgi:protocatechuate 3,4-dioxygenase beta subunit